MVRCSLIAGVVVTLLASGDPLSAQKIQPKKKAAKPKPAKNEEKFPTWTEVKSITSTQLQRRIGYRSGDILSRGDAKRVLDALKKAGWKINDANAIAGQFLSDNDDLVRQLRSRRGVPFMRKLAGNKQVYDRLDRLRKLPLGRRRIPELINNPGGYTLVLYMVKTPGGRNLGRYLNKTRSANNFNQPTGRLYTEKELLDRLRKSYNAEVKKRGDTLKPDPKPKAKPKAKPKKKTKTTV